MSRNKRNNQGKDKQRNPPLRSNAMAAALKAASLVTGTIAETKKPVTERKRDDHKQKPRPKEQADAELEAYQDVGPLRFRERVVTKAIPDSLSRSRPTEESFSKRENNPEHTNKCKNTKNSTREEGNPIDAQTFIAPNGKRKVYIGGDEFLEWGKPKKAISSQKKQQPTTELIITKDTAINRSALLGDQENLYPGSLLDTEPRPVFDTAKEIELVIGLDFGTAYCKAVVQEPDSHMAWAIPFSDKGSNPYILSTRVWQNGETFNLSGKGEAHGNLKVPLLNRDMPPGHAMSVISFLALVIRYIKAWINANKLGEIGDSKPFWSAHTGLPARSLEDKQMVRNFRKLLWAATLLAEQPGPEIDSSAARCCLALVQRAIDSDSDKVTKNDAVVHIDQIGIFPEIAAQIYGYLRSDSRDPDQKTFMLVDVGGGTVDGSIFYVKENHSEELTFNFLWSAVLNLGVYILHRDRLKWHTEQLKKGKQVAEAIAHEFQKMLDTHVMPAKIPNDIEDYLIGAKYPKETADTEFYRRFAGLLWVETGVREYAMQPESLPFLLCGGGRSIGLYNRFIQRINQPESSTSVQLQEISMRKPENLAGEGLGENEYQRLSVAYGLSFPDIGKMLTPDMFPSPPPRQHCKDFRDNYIGPEKI